MDMIERVARAMCPHPSEYGDFLDWVNNDPEGCFLALSKKAIEAMRELPDSMLESVGPMEGFYHDAYGGEEDRCHRKWWAMMIDASLANYPVKPDSSSGPQENPKQVGPRAAHYQSNRVFEGKRGPLSNPDESEKP